MKTEGLTPPTAIMEQAAEWYWEIREPDVSAERIAAWEAWLRAGKANRAAFACIEETLRQVDQLQDVPWPAEGELLEDDYDGSVAISEWRSEGKVREISGVAGRQSRVRFAFTPKRWAIAASVSVLVAAGAITAGLYPPSGLPTPPDLAVFETQAAEHRVVHLPDGSTVTLGGKSTISTAYTPASRFVTLKEGAAYFDVAKDSDRPFIVEAGARRIAAVGTAFNVTRQVDRVVVTVTEGTVVVTPESKEPTAPARDGNAKGSNDIGIARLEAGHQLVYSEREITPVTVVPDLADAIAWREGRLKYRGELLRYVVGDVNRYAKRPIILADEATGQVSYTGTVFEESIDSWLSGLEQVFPVDVEETPEGFVIHLKAKHSDEEM